MISVVIPLFNKKNTIRRAVQSVVEQTYPNWELIIVDDGSTDDSAKEILSFLSDKRIRYIHKVNGGVSSARNRGIMEAKYDWIVYIDADDYFLPIALEVLANIIVKWDVKVGAANYYIEKDGKFRLGLACKKECMIKDNFKACFFRYATPRAGNSIFHKSVLKDDLFDESLCRYEDAKSIFSIMRKHEIAYSPQVIMVYSLDTPGLSKKAEDVSKDFIFSMSFVDKSYWERVQLADLLSQGLRLYNEEANFLKEKYKPFLYWIILSKFYRFPRLISRIFDKFKRLIGC